MKISCTQENLNQGLNIVSHIASKTTSLPILNNVLIKAEDGVISLITTNLEMGIKQQVRGKIEKEGSYTVHAKLLNDYVNLLSKNNIDLGVKDDSLQIKAETQETKIKGQPADEFPLIPHVERKNNYTCQLADFINALAQVLFAVSVSETRPEISGVYMKFNEQFLTLAATDSYRLAEKKIKLAQKIESEKDKEVIVPARTAQELYRILSSLNDYDEIKDTENQSRLVEIFFEDNQVLFVYDQVELVSRIIEGTYPNYKQIIPEDYKTKAIINVAELVKAAKTTSLFSRTGIYDINVELNKDGVVVSSTNNQLGENKSKITSNVNGDDNKIVVNYRYLIDGLQNMHTSDVIFEMTDAANPCVLRPAQALPEGKDPIASEDYLYIIMPIKQ